MSRTLPIVIACTLFTSALVAASGHVADNGPATLNTAVHTNHDQSPAGGPLAARVREVTALYRDINKAIADGYAQFGGCVSGPEIGAMGVHFVNGAYVDATLDVEHPEALIYEMKNGAARLLGVEYITPVAAWNAAHPELPVLNGQHLQIVGTPNRYRLDALYELHVWAWRDNPNGTFVDWNPRVSCDGAQ
jgi:hypothetical protein